jgi:phosphoglycerol transferase MdoB-like AlkP superfamily enzyme
MLGLSSIMLACQDVLQHTSLNSSEYNTDLVSETISTIINTYEITDQEVTFPSDSDVTYEIEFFDKIYPIFDIKTNLDEDITGLFEGKNLITIMLESGVSAALNPTLTPTLYKMTQEGIYFPNHYTENKTYMSETIGIIGNYPSRDFITSRYVYDLPFSLPNVLNQRGYRTVYFHENLGSFFWRDQKIPTLGFEEFYFHNDFFPEEPIYGWGGDYTLDSRTVEAMSEYMFIEDGQPFYYFWTTLVTHGPYDKDYPSDRGINNLEKFKNLGYFEAIDSAEELGLWTNPLESLSEKEQGRFRYYQAAMMDFDYALEKLITMLEEKELLNDTLIIIYGDHSFYHDDIHRSLLEVQDANAHEKEMYKTFFSIYNPVLTDIYNQYYESNTNNKFISPYDIIPTINQLMNIPYYDQMTQGYSIFKEETSVFYSHKIEAYFNDDFYSTDERLIEYPLQEDITDLEEADEFIMKMTEFFIKQSYIDQWIYSHNVKK